MADVTTEAPPGARISASTARAGEASARWHDWVHDHPVGGIVLVAVIATQLGTFFGYVFPAIGLPTLPWPLFNGSLAAPATEFGTASSYFAGQTLHYVNGIVFGVLYAVLVHHMIPLKHDHWGNVLRGLIYGVVLTIISIGVLVPYAYVPKQGYGLFAFSGPDGWKLPAGVLLWHLIYGFFLGVLYQPRDET